MLFSLLLFKLMLLFPGLRYGVMLKLAGGMMILSPPKALGIQVDISPVAISAFSPAHNPTRRSRRNVTLGCQQMFAAAG